MKAKHLIIAALLAASQAAVWGAGDEKITVVGRPDSSSKNSFYVSNREPLTASPFAKLPPGAIEPKGWVRKQLQLEADGFVGHLGEISKWLKKENNAWLDPNGLGHSPWEELVYWVKGYSNLGYVLGDEKITAESKVWIEGILSSVREDGYFGPRENLKPKGGTVGKPDMWPNMIALKVLEGWYEYSGDARVLELMKGYFKWQLSVADKDFLPPFWQQQRAGDNLDSVYWLYNRTGEKELLELAEKIDRNMAKWKHGVANWHGVNIGQCFRSPAIFWQQAKEERYLKAAYRNYDTVMAMYGQVPGGMFGADENCRQGFTGPRQAAETCTMVEMMFSDEILLKITGDPVWADRCEDVAFNSLPASMTADLKALHYLTAPNMTICDSGNKSPGLQNGGAMLLYNPHSHRCCQHNVAHGWPYYAQHLWLATPDNGVAAVMYGPCKVKAKVGDGTEIQISEDTGYPFDHKVKFAVACENEVRFPLYLRVPGWCREMSVSINGKKTEVQSRPGTYVVIERKWADGDMVEVNMPMKIRMRRWAKNKNSVSIDRGPLTYSLKIDEKYVRKGKAEDKWPSWEIHPVSAWNYGLILDERGVERSVFLDKVKLPADDVQPFSVENAPVKLRAKAKKIPGWKMDHFGLVGKLQDSPIKSDEAEEVVTLIPMGCARLRISAFPVIGTGPDAHEWMEPAKPRPANASHCWGGDTVAALSDKVLPTSSTDRSIPRFTWWEHKGTREWVAYEFDEPKKISGVEVYWFEDNYSPGCAIPESWNLVYKEAGRWKEAAGVKNYGLEKDKFNKVTFEPITTDTLRLQVKLREGHSAGILEWRIDTDEEQE